MRQGLYLFLQGANLMEHGYIAVMESHQRDMRENLPHAHLQSQRQISFHSNNDWACQNINPQACLSCHPFELASPVTSFQPIKLFNSAHQNFQTMAYDELQETP